MSKNDHTYQHEDVMQAIVTALMFGEQAGLAAAAEYDAKPDEKVVEIHPEGGSVVHLTAAAAEMLAEAQAILFRLPRGRPHGVRAQPHQPLRARQALARRMDRAKLSELLGILSETLGKGEAAEIDMSEVTPGNTEQVYTDQQIPKREA